MTRLRNAFSEDVIEVTGSQLRAFASLPPNIAAAVAANGATIARAGGTPSRLGVHRASPQPTDRPASADAISRGLDRMGAAGWRATTGNESSSSGNPGAGGDDARRGQSKGKPRGAAAAGNRDRSDTPGKRLAAEAERIRRASEATRRVGQAGAGPSRLNPNAPVEQPLPPRSDPFPQPQDAHEVINVDDEDDAEKDTRGGREEIVRLLAGMYTNMSENEVRPYHFFTRVPAFASRGTNFRRQFAGAFKPDPSSSRTGEI